MDGVDDGAEHPLGQGVVVGRPVGDELGPSGHGGLRSGDPAEVLEIGPAAPAVEELPVLGDPRAGMDRPAGPAPPGSGEAGP